MGGNWRVRESREKDENQERRSGMKQRRVGIKKGGRKNNDKNNVDEKEGRCRSN